MTTGQRRPISPPPTTNPAPTSSPSLAPEQTSGDSRPSKDTLNGFDYGAPAELFPSRSKAGNSRVKYMRFDTAAEAVRFVVEESPTPRLTGAYLVVDERRFGIEQVRYLYENAGYPLARSAPWRPDRR